MMVAGVEWATSGGRGGGEEATGGPRAGGELATGARWDGGKTAAGAGWGGGEPATDGPWGSGELATGVGWNGGDASTGMESAGDVPLRPSAAVPAFRSRAAGASSTFRAVRVVSSFRGMAACCCLRRPAAERDCCCLRRRRRRGTNLSWSDSQSGARGSRFPGKGAPKIEREQRIHLNRR